jgi:hypothetical protein
MDDRGALDALDRLVTEQAIRALLARYVRGIDRLELELVRGCYWSDAVDVHGPFTGTRDEFVVWVSSLLRRHTMTMHHLSSILIEQHGDTAAVETYGVAYHAGEPSGDVQWNNAAGFRYVDQFERRDGEWRIADRITVVDWVTPWQRDEEQSARFGDLSRRDQTDPVFRI